MPEREQASGRGCGGVCSRHRLVLQECGRRGRPNGSLKRTPSMVYSSGVDRLMTSPTLDGAAGGVTGVTTAETALDRQCSPARRLGVLSTIAQTHYITGLLFAAKGGAAAGGAATAVDAERAPDEPAFPAAMGHFASGSRLCRCWPTTSAAHARSRLCGLRSAAPTRRRAGGAAARRSRSEPSTPGRTSSAIGSARSQSCCLRFFTGRPVSSCRWRRRAWRTPERVSAEPARVARRWKARSRELRAAMALAEMDRARGAAHDAVALPAALWGRFTESLATVDSL